MRMTSFAAKVLKIVSGIPRGAVLTYGEVAKRAGNSRAARAVGRILNTYDVKIYPNTPCHRVVAANGLGGYRNGMAKKRALLKKERVLI